MPESPEASSDPILITAGDREPQSVLDALKALPSVRVTISRLKLGDYNVDHRLLVERKTLLDFALSVLDGRLFSMQAHWKHFQASVEKQLRASAWPSPKPRLSTASRAGRMRKRGWPRRASSAILFSGVAKWWTNGGPNEGGEGSEE